MRTKIITKAKKAQIHVEMVVSFVIFLGFLLFLLYYLNPIGREEMNFSSLDKLQDKVINNISIEYKSVSLIINSRPSKECIDIGKNDFINQKFIAYNPDGVKIGAEEQGGSHKINIDPVTSAGTYKILSSDVFTEKATFPPCTSFTDYNWGLVEKSQAVFTDYLSLFNESYINDYFKLKQELGLEKDFDFVVYDENRVVIYNESLSVLNVKGNNILSRDLPLIMINKYGIKKKIILNLRVW